MDNYTEITNVALKYLAYIIASCTPICGLKQVENEEYILNLAKKNRNIRFKDFVRDLPEPSELYLQIYSFAKERNEIKIDVETLCRFFSGQRHITKVLGDIENAGLNNPDKLRLRMLFILIHTLLSLVIYEIKDGRYSGIYENGAYKIRIKNLMAFDGIKDSIGVGKTVFSHYASIICVPSGKFSMKVVSEILEEQAKIDDFSEAAEYFSEIGEIDFDKISKLRDAAEKTASKYGL